MMASEVKNKPDGEQGSSFAADFCQTTALHPLLHPK
jgi:hypothetical protein